MNWIGEWIRGSCPKNRPDCDHCIEARCPGKDKLAQKCKCSPELIGILRKGGKTLPVFADRVARCTRATAEQRDSIVLEKHRGTWQPGKKSAKQPAEKEKKRESAFVKGVVALDKLGNEIGRFRSVREAAERLETSTSVVSSRCLRQIKKVRNEFNALGMTFRHAAEWDRMTSEARAEDMKQIHKGKDE